MTADEWNAATDPKPMLEFLQKGSGHARLRKMVSPPACERKLRLFATACCRRLWPLLADERSRRAVEVNEQFCDGEASLQELMDSHNDALFALGKALEGTEVRRHRAAYLPMGASHSDYGAGFELCKDLADFAALASATSRAATPEQDESDNSVWTAERTVQAAFLRDLFGNPFARAGVVRPRGRVVTFLRDLFGNPFAPPHFDPSWRTSTVLALARGIYDGKTFERLPILADALADAGCENDDLLDHCRGDGPHVRGCWAVDLILGKV